MFAFLIHTLCFDCHVCICDLLIHGWLTDNPGKYSGDLTTHEVSKKKISPSAVSLAAAAVNHIFLGKLQEPYCFCSHYSSSYYLFRGPAAKLQEPYCFYSHYSSYYYSY